MYLGIHFPELMLWLQWRHNSVICIRPCLFTSNLHWGFRYSIVPRRVLIVDRKSEMFFKLESRLTANQLPFNVTCISIPNLFFLCLSFCSHKSLFLSLSVSISLSLAITVSYSLSVSVCVFNIPVSFDLSCQFALLFSELVFYILRFRLGKGPDCHYFLGVH